MSKNKQDVVYTLIVNSLHAEDDGTAVMSNFTVTAEDATHKASVTYSVNLLPTEADTPFTPVDDISDEQKVTWTEAAMNAPGKIGMAGAQREALAELMKQKLPQTSPVPQAKAASRQL